MPFNWTEPQLEMVELNGKALAAGKIEASVSGAIPAAIALPLTIVVSLSSQPSVLSRDRKLLHQVY